VQVRSMMDEMLAAVSFILGKKSSIFLDVKQLMLVFK
jgi:hypothetical protein